VTYISIIYATDFEPCVCLQKEVIESIPNRLHMNSHTQPDIRITRIAVKTFFFISGFVFATWASRIPSIQQKLQLNDAQLGSLLFALPVGLLTSMPITAYLIGRFSSRNILLLGVICYILLLACLGQAESFWQMAILLFCFGAARNLFNISINTQSVGVQDLNQKSIISSFHGIWSLAGLSGAALASVLIGFGLSTVQHFALVSGFVLLIVPLAWSKTLRSPAGSLSQKPVFFPPNRALLSLGLIAFMSMFCEGTMSDWSGIYFKKIVLVPNEYVTMGYLIYLGFMTFGRLVGDWVVNRIGEKKLLMLSGLLIAAGAGLLALFPHVFTASVGFMLTGLGVSCVMPFLFLQASKVSGTPSGVAIATVSVIGYLGFLTGPPLIGFLAHELGLTKAFLLIMMVGLLMSTIIYHIQMVRWSQAPQ
jgi:MFS family permease